MENDSVEVIEDVINSKNTCVNYTVRTGKQISLNDFKEEFTQAIIKINSKKIYKKTLK